MTAGEQLQAYLERFFALRQHGGDALFNARLSALQQMQSERLRATHAALLQDRQLADGIEFLLTDIYGGRDLLPVAREIRRALPMAMKLLPDRVMSTSASALEAAIITQELDEALTFQLGAALDQPLSEQDYAAGYRQLGRHADRQRQLQLIGELGHHLDRYIRSRVIQTTFRMVRRPVHAAGFANLYDFLQNCFSVMQPVPSAGKLLSLLTAREAVIMQRLFDQHPAPFEDA